MKIRPAQPADLPNVCRLLAAAHLPHEDLTAESMQHFLVLLDGSSPLGVVGLEVYGKVALLRSLVVAEEVRAHGHGLSLVENIEAFARQSGVTSIYLLTTTAQKFFSARGYRTIDRQEAPSSIAGTREFSTLCPSTAHLLVKLMRPYNVLFLCTGNSARSILAEAALNRWGEGKFGAFSAGSHPKGQVHPLAIELLRQMTLPTEGYRSKSWDEFAQPGAPQLDFVFTVCDNAAGEACPVWPGQPMTAHWGVDDPAAAVGSDEQKRSAFRKAYRELEARIKIFASLPIAGLDRTRLKAHVDAIGCSS